MVANSILKNKLHTFRIFLISVFLFRRPTWYIFGLSTKAMKPRRFSWWRCGKSKRHWTSPEMLVYWPPSQVILITKRKSFSTTLWFNWTVCVTYTTGMQLRCPIFLWSNPMFLQFCHIIERIYKHNYSNGCSSCGNLNSPIGSIPVLSYLPVQLQLISVADNSLWIHKL